MTRAGEIRQGIARAVSIVAHPVVMMPAAALIAASSRGASALQLRLVGGAVATIGIAVLAYSWLQVRAGHWTHVDASARGERASLNVFLAVLLFLGALLAWLMTYQLHLAAALASSGLLVSLALLASRWVRMSLHVAFAAFATTLVWPTTVAVIAGLIVTAAMVWSRVTLRRHVAVDIIAGLALGAAVGAAYQAWIA